MLTVGTLVCPRTCRRRSCGLFVQFLVCAYLMEQVTQKADGGETRLLDVNIKVERRR